MHTAFSARIESARSEATDHGRTFFERLHWALGKKDPVDRAAIENLARQIHDTSPNPIERFLPDSRTLATVFVRTPQGFQRVMSNIKDESGGSILGTLLNPGHPAIPSLLAGETTTRTVRLFGRDYMMNSRPIINSRGEVIGAIFVGSELSNSLADLKTRIRGLNVGKTGYYYIIDVTPGPGFGNVILHPYREGQKLPTIITSDGKNIFEEMILQNGANWFIPGAMSRPAKARRTKSWCTLKR